MENKQIKWKKASELKKGDLVVVQKFPSMKEHDESMELAVGKIKEVTEQGIILKTVKKRIGISGFISEELAYPFLETELKITKEELKGVLFKKITKEDIAYMKKEEILKNL